MSRSLYADGRRTTWVRSLGTFYLVVGSVVAWVTPDPDGACVWFVREGVGPEALARGRASSVGAAKRCAVEAMRRAGKRSIFDGPVTP